MTTISNNRRRKKISLKTAAFLIVITILLCAAFLFREAAANLLWNAAAPLLSGREAAAASSGNFFAQFASNAALAAQNRELRAALASSTALAADRDILYRENIELKVRLGRSVSEHTVLAAVILRPPGIPYGMLMLDVGSLKGVREGNLVAATGGVYIGRISEVYEQASRVVLFSSPGQKFDGLLRGTIPLTLSGEGAGALTGELPVGTDVSVGDDILLPSIMPQFAARITSVVHEEGSSFQTVHLTLPVNPLELRFVEVHTEPTS